MRQIWHVVSAIKNFLLITTGAILSFKIVNQTYDSQSLIYFILGFFGYIGLSFLEEAIKKND